jgi:hypothetical protein
VRQNGYTTAWIGKWHRGMDSIEKAGAARPLGDSARAADPWSIDYAEPISNRPNAVGCDYFYGIGGSLDMPPFAYIENHHVTELPTVDKGWALDGSVSRATGKAAFVEPDLTSTTYPPHPRAYR